MRANVARALGRIDDAIDDYQKALELKPSEDTRREAEAGIRKLTRTVNPWDE